MIQATASPLNTIMQRRGVRQFVKFCLIGFTSMVIDVGIAWFLTYHLGWHWILSQVISFSIAVTNGFIWNSLWTFRGLNSSRKRVQYAKFVAVNVVGLALNLAIMKSIFFLFTGNIINPSNPDEGHWKIAKAAAVAVVAFWNFFANKYWTFRPNTDSS